MSFAKKQLEKFGWKEGKGLGKGEHGMTNAIKVSLKMDKGGVGHDPGKEFTDHWWLKAFNDAAQQVGTKRKNDTDSESEEEKPKIENTRKENFYKGFVKSSMLSDGVETRHEDKESSDEEDNAQNESVPTLDELHKFCGGATGHKAARHGIKMGGKLSRVAEFDKKFEANLTNIKAEIQQKCTEIIDETIKKSKKKKKRKLDPEQHDTNIEESNDEKRDTQNLDTDMNSNFKRKTKKHKSKHKNDLSATSETSSIDNEENIVARDSKDKLQLVDNADSQKREYKKKKRKKERKDFNENSEMLNIKLISNSKSIYQTVEVCCPANGCDLDSRNKSEEQKKKRKKESANEIQNAPNDKTELRLPVVAVTMAKKKTDLENELHNISKKHKKKKKDRRTHKNNI